MPAKGTTCLYRAVPRDFDDLFIRVGWTSIEAETSAHAKTIAKWLALRNTVRIAAGLISLQSARADHVRQFGPAKNPARMNYVMGRTNRRNDRRFAGTKPTSADDVVTDGMFQAELDAIDAADDLLAVMPIRRKA